MPLVWDAVAGRYVRTDDSAAAKARAAAAERAKAQADMILEKRRQADIAKNRASMATETRKMAEARVATPSIVADYKVEQQKKAAEKAAADRKANEERIFGRQAGQAAAKGYEAAAREQYASAIKRLTDLYSPEKGSLDAQEAARLKLLSDAISGATGDITRAEEEFLKYLPTSTAYEGVPLVNLPIEQNPLIAALQSQGAGTGSVEAQRALDVALSQQLQQLGQRSAEQTGAAEQAYLDALRRSGVGAGAAGRQYLAQQQPALEAAYRSEFDKARAELARQQAKDQADAEEALRKALLEAEKVRMETTQEFGPVPTKTSNVVNAPTAPVRETVPVQPRSEVAVQPVARTATATQKKKELAQKAIAGLIATIEGR
jgi:hypothetical protein